MPQNFLSVLKETFSKEKKYCAAVVVAAGNSSRMKNFDQKSKLFIEINYRPLICYTLEAFENADLIDEVILVTRQEDIINMGDIVKSFEYKKVSNIVVGGSNRQESVIKGLNEISDNKNVDFIAVHDGARPLITGEEIDNVVKHAYETGAAIAASKCKDTVKLSGKDNKIDATLNRDFIYFAGTPQVFLFKKYKELMNRAIDDNLNFTDDSQIFEYYKYDVSLVDVGFENIKITTSEDVFVANMIINKRG